jgi:hypothetical protein
MFQTEQYLLIIGVPPESEREIMEAIARGGAGVVGDYTECAFVFRGEGHFRAGSRTSPAVGKAGENNAVPEIRIETTVSRERLKDAVTAIRAAHPYEEPVIYIIPILDWKTVISDG